jgi:hypothetical protein
MRENWCKVISLALVAGTLISLPAHADLRLTEILSAPVSDWDGDGAVDSKLDEWVEVTNTGASPVDLQNVYLRDGTGTAWHFGFSGTLAAGQSLLVTGAASVQWQAENSAGTSGLSLNNSGDFVELWRAPETGDPVLLDSATVPGHAAGSDRAYAWLTLAASWILYDGLNPYGGDLVPTGTGCVPSPGVPNTCSVTVPVGGPSVSRIKTNWE